MLSWALFIVFPAICAFAAAMDFFTMTIPNRISLALAALFFVIFPFSGLGWYDLGLHLLTGFVVLLLSIGMFALRWFGGGDAKMLAAVALWFGPSHMFEYLIFVAFSGGVLAMAILMFRSMPLPLFLASESWALRLHERRGGIPYGIALATGALLVYPSTEWFQALAG